MKRTCIKTYRWVKTTPLSFSRQSKEWVHLFSPQLYMHDPTYASLTDWRDCSVLAHGHGSKKNTLRNRLIFFVKYLLLIYPSHVSEDYERFFNVLNCSSNDCKINVKKIKIWVCLLVVCFIKLQSFTWVWLLYAVFDGAEDRLEVMHSWTTSQGTKNGCCFWRSCLQHLCKATNMWTDKLSRKISFHKIFLSMKFVFFQRSRQWLCTVASLELRPLVENI